MALVLSLYPSPSLPASPILYYRTSKVRQAHAYLRPYEVYFFGLPCPPPPSRKLLYLDVTAVGVCRVLSYSGVFFCA